MPALALAATVLAASLLPLAQTHTSTGASEESAPAYCALNVATGASDCVADMSQAPDARRAVNAGPEATQEGSRSSASAAAADVLVGRLYGALNYGGAIYELFFTSVCNTSSAVDWQVANVGSGFNDQTSSFRGYAGCKLQIWENASFGGATYGPLATSSYVGDAMNDRTTSVKGS